MDIAIRKNWFGQLAGMQVGSSSPQVAQALKDLRLACKI